MKGSITAAILGTPIVMLLLGTGVLVGGLALFNQLVPFLTIIFLSLVGLILIGKSVEFNLVSDNKALPIVVFLLGLGCLGYALFMLNPDLFTGKVSFAIAGTEQFDATVKLEGSEMFSIMDIEDTPLSQLDGFWQSGFHYVLIGSVIAFAFMLTKQGEKVFKIKRR